MQLKNLAYRDKALSELKEFMYEILGGRGGSRQKIVFKAPTGSGKTVTMACLLRDLADELPNHYELPNRNVAYIWIAPNTLHLQSYRSIGRFFQDNSTIKALQFEDIEDSALHPNEVLFLNWQSISNEQNLFIKYNEKGRNLANYLSNTRDEGTEIVVILDEAHLFGTKGEKAQKVLALINAAIEIDVTATPLQTSEYMVNIRRQQVVKEQMIKKGVHLNPRLDEVEQGGRDADLILLQQALEQRRRLWEAYRAEGKNINPLLLIQLPSDSAKMSDEDKRLKDKLLAYLDTKNINAEMNSLAVWLSSEKLNLEDISKENSSVDALVFKQAIALGWDCPRAAVLLIYREMKQEAFTVQTVGRILRMPEQVHYADESLNYGYVYTNLQSKYITIGHDETDYLLQNKALRKSDYEALQMESFYREFSKTQRNRIGLDFKPILFETAENRWAIQKMSDSAESSFAQNAKKANTKGINLAVQEVEIEIPTNIFLTDEIADNQQFSIGKQKRFAKTNEQLRSLYERFCRTHCGDFQIDGSWERIAYHLQLLLLEYFGIAEYQAFKVILNNEQAFIDLLNLSQETYKQHKTENAKPKTSSLVAQTWEVPAFRIYSDNYLKFEVEKHILTPLFLRQRGAGKLADSDTEFDFVQFLEKNKANIVWWYKNGAGGKEDFAIPYTSSKGSEDLFFPDFVVLFQNGNLGIFDTKTLASDHEMVNKHNALSEYASQRSREEKITIGSIAIYHQGSWRYNSYAIEKNDSVEGWAIFNPSHH